VKFSRLESHMANRCPNSERYQEDREKESRERKLTFEETFEKSIQAARNVEKQALMKPLQGGRGK
jgi:hypothetical protein